MLRFLVRWICTVLLLTTSLIALARLGDGALAPPPLSLQGAIDWASTRDPAGSAFALLRVGALAVGAYLLFAVVVGGIVWVFDERLGHRVLDRLTLGLTRGLFGLMGVGAITVAIAPTAGAQTSTARTAVIREVDPPSQRQASAVIRPLPDQPAPTITAASEPASTPTSEQYVIAGGDSLWRVAATRLGEATGRTDLSDAEIASYWRSVIAANSSLPNPDLLFVGQVIELPAVAP